MVTSNADRVISQRTDARIAAADAHELAGITYRQLDHWARQGWVRPSVATGEGRAGRRLYSIDDVLRLDLLRHLAKSKVNTSVAGPAVASFVVPDGDVRVLWGPVAGSAKDNEAVLSVAPAVNALDVIEKGGAFVVYNPMVLRSRLNMSVEPDITPAAKNEEPSARRSRTA